MFDLTQYWLNRCQTKKSYDLLSEYQYRHDWCQYGDIGGLNVRLSGKFFEQDDDGDFMIAQPVWLDPPSLYNPVEKPLLFDLIVWHPEDPHRWYFMRGEPGLILGERALFKSSICREPLLLHTTPFAWLKSGCTGSVLLDHHGLNKLYCLKEVVCEDINHGTRIEKGLSMYYLKNMPRISVPALTENRI